MPTALREAGRRDGPVDASAGDTVRGTVTIPADTEGTPGSGGLVERTPTRHR